jgi:hypothetical protein
MNLQPITPRKPSAASLCAVLRLRENGKGHSLLSRLGWRTVQSLLL